MWFDLSTKKEGIRFERSRLVISRHCAHHLHREQSELLREIWSGRH